MFKAVKNVFKNYACFKGRARRSEFWYFALFQYIVVIVLMGTGMALMNTSDLIGGICILLMSVFSLACILPNLAVYCRRLHDVGKSGSYFFFGMIPVVGSILLFVWTIQDGQPWENQYGPDPKGRNNPVAVAVIQQGPKQSETVKQESQPETIKRTVPAETVAAAPKVRISCTCARGVIQGATVTGTRVVIGRDPGLCQMVFPANTPGISKVHCELKLDGNNIALTDLGSTYGTYLSSGKQLPANTPAVISNGDYFFLSDQTTVITAQLC